MAYAQARIWPREWDAQTPLGFWETNRSPNLGHTTRPSNSQQQQKRELADFVVRADHRVKLKVSEKKRISIWTLLGNWKNCGT